MKILMLGWEFPPKISGGLGVASKSLAEAMAGKGHQVTFLLPKKNKSQVSSDVKLVDASTLKPDVDLWKEKKVYSENLSETSIGSLLMPYLAPELFAKTKTVTKTVLEPTEESELLERIELTGTYEANLSAEILKYAMLAVQVAKKSKPDVVHAHDWITFRAAVLIKKTLGLPIILHTHSTEHDRNGIYAQQHVVDEEQSGFDSANLIIAVSQKLKYTIVGAYGIDSSKIQVVPNILDIKASTSKNKSPKHIAFVGRLTHQKSPSIFIDIARDLCSKGYEYNFSVIGDGYLRNDLEHRVATSNFSDRIRFDGFLDRNELLKRFSTIDLLVIPSASEPFGLVALEAILKGIPVAAARGIGLGEFIPSIPQVERWDHYSYVKLVERLMTDTPYREDVVKSCQKEAERLTQEKSTALLESIYQQALEA
ncbi:MAG: hypothetical protein CMP48_16925 [Rickettsiales bacterium]|nr:hypothetical protein [Rickettsiales bacterium]